MIKLRDPLGIELEAGSMSPYHVALFDKGAHLVHRYEVLHLVR